MILKEQKIDIAMHKFCNPLFIHSDIGRGIIAAKRSGMEINSKDMQTSLMRFLAQMVDGGEESLIFPAFNYRFGQTRLFDPALDPVEVGALPEWVRQQKGVNRTLVPFFSVLSWNELDLKMTEVIDPFGAESVFDWLVKNDALIMLFGVSLNSLTFLHYVEEISGGPVYRYQKNFSGQVVVSGEKRSCDLTMHVRPMGAHLDYDWPRLKFDLLEKGILMQDSSTQMIMWLRAKALLEYWGNQIADNPFYLLDDPSSKNFDEVTDGGRVRVQLEDFENV